MSANRFAAYPTLDSRVRAIPPESRLDAVGRVICVYCDKRLRWNTGWGYDGAGIFCSMKCAATWGNIKASSGDEDRPQPT
jgi:hypothetical protein